MNNENSKDAANYYGDGSSARRKQVPLATGLHDYFPNALAAVAEHSYFSNEKHNPGQKLHWSRYNSADHADAAARHLRERGGYDNEGRRHSAGLAWRALAVLEEELIAEGYTPGRGTSNSPPYAEKGTDDAILASPVDRILGGRPEAGFKSFSDFEEQRDVKAAVRKAPLSEKDVLAALQSVLGPDATIITDPREWYALTGAWPEGVVKSGADENWIAEFDFYSGSQFEVTPAGKKALEFNRIKPAVKRGKAAPAARKSASRPKAALPKAARAPARKR